MSKKQKLRIRLNSQPKDFTWDELVTLLNHYGFEVMTNTGSKRKFVNSAGRLFSCHSPHPSNIVKSYVVKDLQKFLDEIDSYE